MARKTTSKRFSTVPPTTAPTKEAAGKAATAKAAKAAVTAEIPASVVAKAIEAKVEAPKVESAKVETPKVESPAMAAGKVEVAAATPATPATPASVTAPAVDIAPMLTELYDPDADVARDGAVSLGHSGNKAAVEPLIEALRNGDGYYHGVVRAAAAASLGQLGDVRAFDALVDAINDSMSETSAEAVRALATLGDHRAIQPLINIVRNSDGFFLPVVRRAAVIALKKLGGEQATAELQSVAACTWEDFVIRQEAGYTVSDSQ